MKLHRLPFCSNTLFFDGHVQFFVELQRYEAVVEACSFVAHTPSCPVELAVETNKILGEYLVEHLLDFHIPYFEVVLVAVVAVGEAEKVELKGDTLGVELTTVGASQDVSDIRQHCWMVVVGNRHLDPCHRCNLVEEATVVEGVDLGHLVQDNGVQLEEDNQEGIRGCFDWSWVVLLGLDVRNTPVAFAVVESNFVVAVLAVAPHIVHHWEVVPESWADNPVELLAAAYDWDIVPVPAMPVAAENIQTNSGVDISWLDLDASCAEVSDPCNRNPVADS